MAFHLGGEWGGTLVNMGVRGTPVLIGRDATLVHSSRFNVGGVLVLNTAWHTWGR
jgi:hypothetical protein